MFFFLYQEEKKKLARPLTPGGPLLYRRSKNLSQGRDEKKLIRISDDNVLILCPDGQPFDGIVERIGSDNWSGAQIYGLIQNFALEFLEPPSLGECLLTAALGATAVRALPAPPEQSSSFYRYELTDIDLSTRKCSFILPRRYEFAGKSILYM